MERPLLTTRLARFPEDAETVRGLLRAYRETPGVAECVVSFDEELAGLPGRYAPGEGGAVVLAFADGETVGCGALRRIGEGVCEMKRLYVSGAARGGGAGRMIVEALTAEARAMGYGSVRLDTLPSMTAAIALYEALGFRPIARYYDGAPAEARFFELAL